jgi:hypothetical protein
MPEGLPSPGQGPVRAGAADDPVQDQALSQP